MIKVQNENGSVINVLNVVVENGQIISEARRPKKGTRFYNSYPMMLPAGTSEDGRDLHTLADGWELVTKGERKKRQPKQEVKEDVKQNDVKDKWQEFADLKSKHPDTTILWRMGDFYEAYDEDAITCGEVLGITVTANGEHNLAGFPYHALDTYLPRLIRAGHRVAIYDGNDGSIREEEEVKTDTDTNAQDEVHEEESVKTNDEQEVNVKQEAQAHDDVNDDDVTAIAEMLLKLKKGSAPINKDMVVKIVKDVLADELPKVKPQEVQHTIKVADLPEYKCPKGTNPKLLETIMTMVVNDRVIGRFPWLFGPAGSGKSTLASKVAEALHIPFYSVSSLQQKYELEGYTDAVGEFVQTAFYKAMAEGGIFTFDEISTTSGEVQVAFNTAAAQLVYNFPKMGMVKAHPDFHIIACDNSTGRGGDKRYISRFQLDASTLDRYDFVEVDYSDEHDLNMAAGDKSLVKFMHDMRKVLDASNTTYLATPRASKAIKALQACGMSDKDALWYGLCSGWNKQDIRTFAGKLNGSTAWHQAFENIANGL